MVSGSRCWPPKVTRPGLSPATIDDRKGSGMGLDKVGVLVVFLGSMALAAALLPGC